MNRALAVKQSRKNGKGLDRHGFEDLPSRRQTGMVDGSNLQ